MNQYENIKKYAKIVYLARLSAVKNINGHAKDF